MVMRNPVSSVVLVMALAVSQGLAQVDGPQHAAITASLPPGLPPGLEPVPPENWTAEMLLGAEVRDRAETPVAEVRDVQLTREGRLLGLLVEIGGLWGIGAKTVAVPLAQVTVARPVDAASEPALRVHLAISADALKALPEVEG